MINKPQSKIDNVHFLIYSNENTLPIVDLSLKYFDKHFGLDNIKITVASNKFLTDDLSFKDKVNYISADVPFCNGGGHFSKTISNAIDIIEEKYIFYYCEDYINIDPVQWDKFAKLINLLDKENIDLFTFSNFRPDHFNKNNTPGTFKVFEKCEEYGFNIDDIFYVGEEQIHRYSLQPGIWNKNSLKEILSYNPHMTLHHLDSSHIKGKKGSYRDRKLEPFQQYVPWLDTSENYNHKVLTCKNMIFDYYPDARQQFVISYLELMRSGKICFHGSSLLSHIEKDNWVRIEIDKIVKENDLYNDRRYDKFIGEGKIYF